MVFYRLQRGRKDDAQPLTLGFERAGDAGETDRWNNIVISLSQTLSLSLKLERKGTSALVD
jgi:hypothetical protein